MLCSNCGKDIPFTGKVCPWCHSDKAKDQRLYAWGMCGAVMGIIVGFAIGSVTVGVVGFVVGAFGGMGIATATQK